MRKVTVLFFVSLILVGLLIVSVVLADSGSSNSNSGSDEEEKTVKEIRDGDIKTKIERRIKNGEVIEKIETMIGDKKEVIERRIKSDEEEKKIRERIKKKIGDNEEVAKKVIKFKERVEENGGIIDIKGRVIKINNIDEEEKEVIVGKVKLRTRFELAEDENIGEELRAMLSNGRFADIKIMPDKAAAIALAKLKAKCFVEEHEHPEGEEDEHECDIELKEVEDGSVKKFAFEVNGEKESRLFLIFKKKIKVKAEVDAETGEIIKTKKPWWAILANEREENKEEIKKDLGVDEDVEVGDKVVICHIPPGNPDAQHTIVVGAPAVKAHLAHGDSLGACEGDIPDSNETTPGNQTDMNETELTLNIESPKNVTYNITDILVNISSNGETILFSINNGTNETYTGSVIKTFQNGTNTLNAFANSSKGDSLTDSVTFNVVIDSNITLPGNESMNNTNNSV